MSPYRYCCAWGQKDWVERKGKNRQLHRTKAGSEKDLEVVPSRSYFAWNWSPRSDIEKIERLAEEFRCKE